jgi:hypothetical protein
MALPINLDRIECANRARLTQRSQSRTSLDDASFRRRRPGLGIQYP